MPLLSIVIVIMDGSSHLSVILGLCPTQWLLSAQALVLSVNLQIYTRSLVFFELRYHL